MPQHTLYFDAIPLSDDSYEMFQFEQALERTLDTVVNDAFFEEAKQQPNIREIEVRVFFRFNACGCAFSSQPEAGFSYLSTLTAGQARLNSIHLTARDWIQNGMDKNLAWKLSVKNTFNEQAKQPLPNYHEQVSKELWTHILLAAKNALINHLLQPQTELSDTCTRAHAEQIDALITKLAKITLHYAPNAVVYRSTLFTAANEHGRSHNTDDWEQAAELELLAEEPYATFLHRDTAADLRNILAAAGLNPALTKHYEDSNGKAVMINI